MNLDDPKFTAYALDELEPAKRAEIELLLHDDPTAAAEVDGTRAFAAALRTRLQTEPAEGLHPAQRADVLATVVAERPRNVITFSRRAAIWGALAASVIIGIGWAVILPALNRAEKKSQLSASRIRMARSPPSRMALMSGCSWRKRAGPSQRGSRLLNIAESKQEVNMMALPPVSAITAPPATPLAAPLPDRLEPMTRESLIALGQSPHTPTPLASLTVKSGAAKPRVR